MSLQVGDIVVYTGNGDAIWGRRRESGQRYMVVEEHEYFMGLFPLLPHVVPDDETPARQVLLGPPGCWDVVERASYESTEGPAHLIDAEGDVWIEEAPDNFNGVGGGGNLSLQRVIDRYGLAAARR